MNSKTVANLGVQSSATVRPSSPASALLKPKSRVPGSPIPVRKGDLSNEIGIASS
jgi:hypothetical protein